MGKEIIVSGGGIVGVCSALQLQCSAHKVTLIDAKKPRRETSYCNAGVFDESSIVVLNNPELLRVLPKLLFCQDNTFPYNFVLVLKQLPWVLKFLSYRRALHMIYVSCCRFYLTNNKNLIASANVGHLLREVGWLKVFRHEASFDRFITELNVLRSAGVRFVIFNREQISQTKPNQTKPCLKPIYCKAILTDEACTASSPSDLTDAYVELFAAVG